MKSCKHERLIEGEPAVRDGQRTGEKDTIFKGMDAVKLGRLFELIDENPQIGSFRIWASSPRREVSPIMGIQLQPEGDIRSLKQFDQWGAILEPMPTNFERDPSCQLWAISLKISDIHDSSIAAQDWRQLYNSICERKINHTHEPVITEGVVRLILKRLQVPQLTDLFRLLDDMNTWGSFVLTGSSDRWQARPHVTVAADPVQAWSLYGIDPRTFKAMQEQADRKDQRSKSDTVTPMR